MAEGIGDVDKPFVVRIASLVRLLLTEAKDRAESPQVIRPPCG